MTFFLGEKTGLQRRGPNVALPTNAEGVGAAITTYFREIDTFNGVSDRTEMEKVNLGKSAGERLGIETLNQWYTENDAGYDHLRPAPTTVDDFISMHGERGTDMILEMARKKAAEDPEAWRDMDMSPEGINARVTEGLKASDAVDAENLALSPNPVRNAIVGGLAAGVLDPVNLAALPFGLGGGSLLRVMGREAVINGTIEGIQQPTRAKTAELLGREAPGFVESVAQGAVFGAVLGGVMDAIPRGMRALAYYREAKRVEVDPSISRPTQEAGIQAAEQAIATGRPVDEAVTRAILAEPPAAKRPLILDESMAVTPEPTALAPDPITEMPLAPVEGIQSTTDQIVATAKSGLAKANKGTKEVLGWLKRGGVDPNGWLGTELKARGLNHKSYPGLFKKGGVTDIDNIVADELDQVIPGISYRAGRDGTGTYLDRDGLLRVLDEELGPAKRTKVYERDYVPERAWADPDPEQRGFMVDDLEARKFAEPDTWQETLVADVEGFIESRGFNLLPRERDEILSVVTTRGGDVEDLVYSAMSREIDEGEQAVVRAQRGEAYGRPASDVPWGEETGLGPVPDSPDGGPVGQPQAAPGNAPESGARAGEFAVERTDIGDQFVIPGTREAPGVDKTRQQAEIEARKIQSKMRRLNQARVEDDVDGLFAAKTVDMFDDLNSPEAQSFMDANVQAMRDMLDEGDFEVSAMADDGRALTSLSDILDEIDDDATLMREFDLCRFGGTTE